LWFQEAGEKKMLLVLKTDSAETAARRFAVQNGVSAAGQLVRKHAKTLPRFPSLPVSVSLANLRGVFR
jgi:hypothetical protein